MEEQKEVLKKVRPASMEKVITEVSRMLQTYAGYQTALGEVSQEWRDPFKVLIATILSSRTKDQVTEKAAKRLFQRFKGVKELAEAEEGEVEALIKPVGFYRVKARRIIEVSKVIRERFDGAVPEDLDNLLTLPMVGRKTANCVLVYGFQKPAIPVDTHVHRISNRLNLVQTRTPQETERDLTKTVDQRYWFNLNDLFVRFGQTVCKPVKPRCEICSLREYCAYYNAKVAPVVKSRSKGAA